MSALNTSQLRKLWAAAQEKPEWAATKFWEYVFKDVFTGRRWAIASQQPPTDDDDDLRRVDLVVENVDDNLALLFMEAKRAAVTTADVETVEYQAFTACCAHLYSKRRRAVWAMTCVGTMTRFWAYEYDADYITQFWPPGDGLSRKSEYVDYSTHGRKILEILEHIKENPIPCESIFNNPPSPRPANATLPVDWHDDEVQLIPSTSTQPQPAYQAPGEPDLQMSDYPPVGQSRANMELDASQAIEAVVYKFDGEVYECNRQSDGGRIHVPADGWNECVINISGQLCRGYSWVVPGSGNAYYTFSLESERRKEKKGKK